MWDTDGEHWRGGRGWDHIYAEMVTAGVVTYVGTLVYISYTRAAVEFGEN